MSTRLVKWCVYCKCYVLPKARYLGEWSEVTHLICHLCGKEVWDEPKRKERKTDSDTRNK